MTATGEEAAKEVKTALKCDLSRKELRDDGKQIGDECPICKQLVGLHERRFKTSETAIRTKTTKAATTSTSSTRDPFRGITFPKYTKAQACVLFIKKVEQLLIFHNVDKVAWPRALVGVMEEPTWSDWVVTNIVNANLDWDDAKDMFIKHFQSTDYNIILLNQYHSCSQRENESVQSFSDRFVSLVDQLGYAIHQQSLSIHYRSLPLLN